MEKEQIIKALDVLEGAKVMVFNVDFDEFQTAIITAINALTLIREQDKRISELTEENERLKATRYMLHTDGSLEMIPSVESVRADTVRKMAERLKDRYEFNCNADEDNALYYVDLCEWVERIEKEILEGGDTNDTV